MSGCSRMRSTASLSPWTTLNTPSGSPAAFSSSASSSDADGSFSRGLQDERVAARQGVGEHPHRHHDREVERRDPGHHAEGLADGVHVDAGRRLLAELALQQVRDAAGELDVLQAPGHLAQGVGEDLAVLGVRSGQLLAVGVDQLPEVEHAPRCAATGRWPARPGNACLRHADGGVDLSGGGQVDLGLLLAGRRVPDRPSPASARPATIRPPIQCDMRAMCCSPSLRSGTATGPA